MDSITILLIDDEDIVLDITTRMLKKLGHHVIPVKSGMEAVTIFREKKAYIDLIILDMIMPEIGGRETYEALKEIEPGARILLSSGYSDLEEVASIMDRGCNGFIQKPFDVTRLDRKIREIFDAQ